MKKPHEETWMQDKDMVADGDFSAVDAEGFVVLTTYSALDADTADAECEARLSLATAAPDMARALMAQGKNRYGQWHTRECWAARRGCIIECQSAYAALKKAGVLP